MKYYFYIGLICFGGFSSAGLLAQPGSCLPPSGFETLDINNVEAGLLTGGDLWHNGLHDAVYEVPRVGAGDTSRHSLFAGGLWIGGFDQSGNLKLAAQTFRTDGQDFWPGPASQICNQWDRLWKVNLTEVELQKQNYQIYGNNIPLNEIPKSVLEWPGNGNPYVKGKNGSFILVGSVNHAPYVDVNNDKSYNPVEGDYPDIIGDQMVWWIFNDFGNVHSASGGAEIGLHVKATAYAFNTPDALGNTTFYHFEVNKVSTGRLDSVYVGLWVDADIGFYPDDEVGYIASHNMGVGFNGDPVDGPALISYGSNPPVIGVKILKGPQENDSTLGMTHFVEYSNDSSNTGNPELPQQYYNYLSGRWKDGTPWTTAIGDTTPFAGVSLPDTAERLCQRIPSDKRFLLISGPFTLEQSIAGQNPKTLDFAVVWSRCDTQYACPPAGYADFQCLLDDADYVQQMFDSDFPLLAHENMSLPIAADIFPLPAKDAINVRLDGIRTAEIVLMDLTGKSLNTYQYRESPLRIKRDNLPSGMYFLKIRVKGKTDRIYKIILQ